MDFQRKAPPAWDLYPYGEFRFSNQFSPYAKDWCGVNERALPHSCQPKGFLNKWRATRQDGNTAKVKADKIKASKA
jgi:hypothetical protein